MLPGLLSFMNESLCVCGGGGGVGGGWGGGGSVAKPPPDLTYHISTIRFPVSNLITTLHIVPF